MNRTVLTIATALATAPAFAQVPGYDTARHCAEFAKRNHTVENACHRDEADARRELERSRFSQEILAERYYSRLWECFEFLADHPHIGRLRLFNLRPARTITRSTLFSTIWQKTTF